MIKTAQKFWKYAENTFFCPEWRTLHSSITSLIHQSIINKQKKVGYVAELFGNPDMCFNTLQMNVFASASDVT